MNKNKNIELWKLVPVVIFSALLLPEYIAPVLTLICAIITIKYKIKNHSPIDRNDIFKSSAVFIAWMVLGLFYSKYIVSGIIGVGLWLLMFGGFIFVTEFIDSEHKLDAAIYYGALSSGILGIIGIGQMFLFHISPKLCRLFNPFWHSLDCLVAKFAVFILPESIEKMLPRTSFISIIDRASGTLSNPLFFATLLVSLLPFSAYIFLFSQERKKRIIGFICLICVIGGVAASYSRGPYLYCASVFIILLLYGKKHTAKLIGIGAGFVCAILIFANGTIKRLITLTTTGDISVNTRLKIWQAVSQLMKNKPIFGYGTGVNNIREQLHNIYHINQPHAHNIVFEIILENGAIGSVIFLGIIFLFSVNIFKMFKKGGKAKQYAITFFASIFGIFLCGMTDCVFYGLKPLQYFFMILALSQSAYNIYNNNQSKTRT